ncbi:MAG: DUF3617 domain-containing protein [Fimbriimonadaceae bacterium]|nr:DUF3617 domain-containing protein [Fimbriimonadaceae bacterium]
MKKLTLFAALVALLIVGCAKKEEAGTDTGSTGSTAASTTGGGDDKKTTETTDATPTEGKDATKDQLVGTWNAEMNEESEMKMTAKMTVTLNADDTYTMEMTGNFEGENSGIKMSGDISAKQTGKWKIDAGNWTNTPDAGSTTGGVSNFKYEASDPKMQEALKGQEATMEKTFQENFTKSLEKENKQTIKSVSATEMVTENEGKTVTWKKG